MNLLDNHQGNYRFLKGIAPYSSGVLAMPDHEIVHVVFRKPLAYHQGFASIARHLEQHQRPPQALCAISLRIPQPFTFDGFAQFNAGYQKLLAAWDLLVDGNNPVARTNVAPEVSPPPEAVLYGFAFTVPAEHDRPTFVIAGAGDLKEQNLTPAAIIRPGETSAAALHEKATYVMSTMQRRLTGLQLDWHNVTTVNIYTVQTLQPYLAPVILNNMGPAAIHSVHWHYSHPPIAGLAFEMDIRGIRQEQWL